MAQWKVFRDSIELFPHPNADSLELAKIGSYQVVVAKGSHSPGDEAVFIPEKSILPDAIAEPYRNYLRGPDRNRVGSVRLRGELSMGIVLSLDKAIEIVGSDIASSVCIAHRLGIEKYEPPIPQCLAGEVEPAPQGLLSQHDVEQFGIYASCFQADEEVIVTEKLHGSQVMYYLLSDGTFGLSSKGLLSRGLAIKDSAGNTYWNAARNSQIEPLMRECADCLGVKGTLQFFGEVIPVQGANWNYGLNPSRPQVRLFDIRVDGVSVSRQEILPYKVADTWVPVIATGRFSEMNFQSLCQGMESVSGKLLHIREGVVVRPVIDRRAPDGVRLMVKVINPKYAKKETGEEVS